MIDRLRLTAGAKQQLITLKRRTGLEHYNVICRHALCASLANPAPAPDEHLQFANGLEIEWKTFAGEADATYLNLLIVRSIADEGDASPATVRRTLSQHVHRGLSYLVSRQDSLLAPSAESRQTNADGK
jgi:DNA sulfur modification protein DndE